MDQVVKQKSIEPITLLKCWHLGVITLIVMGYYGISRQCNLALSSNSLYSNDVEPNFILPASYAIVIKGLVGD